jgi:hypothetical protein
VLTDGQKKVREFCRVLTRLTWRDFFSGLKRKMWIKACPGFESYRGCSF